MMAAHVDMSNGTMFIFVSTVLCFWLILSSTIIIDQTDYIQNMYLYKPRRTQLTWPLQLVQQYNVLCVAWFVPRRCVRSGPVNTKCIAWVREYSQVSTRGSAVFDIRRALNTLNGIGNIDIPRYTLENMWRLVQLQVQRLCVLMANSRTDTYYQTHPLHWHMYHMHPEASP